MGHIFFLTYRPFRNSDLVVLAKQLLVINKAKNVFHLHSIINHVANIHLFTFIRLADAFIQSEHTMTIDFKCCKMCFHMSFTMTTDFKCCKMCFHMSFTQLPERQMQMAWQVVFVSDGLPPFLSRVQSHVKKGVNCHNHSLHRERRVFCIVSV